MEDIRSSILQMAKGAIQERVDYEVTRVIDNILDVNTKPTEKRKVVLTIEMKPDEARQVITLSASAKSTLAATTRLSSGTPSATGLNSCPIPKSSPLEVDHGKEK